VPRNIAPSSRLPEFHDSAISILRRHICKWYSHHRTSSFLGDQIFRRRFFFSVLPEAAASAESRSVELDDHAV